MVTSGTSFYSLGMSWNSLVGDEQPDGPIVKYVWIVAMHVLLGIPLT